MLKVAGHLGDQPPHTCPAPATGSQSSYLRPETLLPRGGAPRVDRTVSFATGAVLRDLLAAAVARFGWLLDRAHNSFVARAAPSDNDSSFAHAILGSTNGLSRREGEPSP